MSIFRRRRPAADDPPAGPATHEGAESAGATEDGESAQPAHHADGLAGVAGLEDAASAADARRDGPFDVSEVSDTSGHLDLGSLLVTGVEGMELRLEVDQDQQSVIAATAVLGDSALQVQAFAAPRTSGLWDEIRAEIADAIVGQGGTVESASGPHGPELRTRMPSAGPDGRTVFAPARFLGVDGPRWFLRGVLSGRAAIEEPAAEPLLAIYAATVVVRGADPMAPRELLPLTLPREAGAAAAPADEGDDLAAEGEAGEAPVLDPFERGPEITEVR
ncbi:MAG TPA: DUF3710 domain-containing protein [Dermatophilaceae bacterium]|nr:DUF3710 domain-containing protein [Dermatophilaceae bacterium]